ncbi:hypothetical protein BSKO_10127 [Bryopsis sp. KO-2023]|nr:hypothetical protein BSKO_10127 [Bryopsis sp. KO-2023]
MTFKNAREVAAAICLSLAVLTRTAAAEWDYIVVGAGASGCAVSSSLASNGSKSVLVLEAGEPTTWDFGGREQKDYFHDFGGDSNVTVFDIPGEATLLLTEEGFAARPQFWWDTVPWAAQGKGVGGSGAVNIAISFSGSPEDFDGWPQGWSYDEMEPFYSEVLEATNIGHVTSADGELYLHEAGDVLNRVMKNHLGFKESDLKNPVRVNTTSFTEHYTKNGQRFDSCLAFLLPALNTQDNIKLRTNSPVKRIVFSKRGRASGVELENEEMINLKEGGKVVVTAGPLNTPKLLMYSGIGPIAELKRLHKNGLVHNPKQFWIINREVGVGVHDHYLGGMKVVAPETSENVQFIPDYDDTEALSNYFNERSGFLAQFLVPRLGFLALAGRSAPDFELAALAQPRIQEDCSNCFDAFMLTLKPTSTDTLRIYTPDLNCSCGDQPCKVGDFCRLDVYLTNEKDLSEATLAFRTFMKAFQNEGFKASLAQEAAIREYRIQKHGAFGCSRQKDLRGACQFQVVVPPFDDAASIRAFLTDTPSGGVGLHFAGSCSLGRCTDENMRVKRTENVFVADSSVFPEPVRAHNVVTSIAVGRKAAFHISNFDT